LLCRSTASQINSNSAVGPFDNVAYQAVVNGLSELINTIQSNLPSGGPATAAQAVR
jgi:hypothetical protein